MTERSGFKVINQVGLIADGSAAIIIIQGERPIPGFGDNINFTDSANPENCKLINCQIEYGGGNINFPGMIYCDQCSPIIRNCYIEYSGTWGIFLNGNVSIENINSNIFYNNVYGDYFSAPK